MDDKLSINLPATQNSSKKKKLMPRGRPNPQNLTPFKSREELGGQLDPRINVGGRPKLLKGAYAKALAEIDEDSGKTHAELIAESMINNAKTSLPHSVSAAKELRQATEYDDEANKGGDIKSIRVDVILLLQKLAKGDTIEGEFEKLES